MVGTEYVWTSDEMKLWILRHFDVVIWCRQSFFIISFYQSEKTQNSEWSRKNVTRVEALEASQIKTEHCFSTDSPKVSEWLHLLLLYFTLWYSHTDKNFLWNVRTTPVFLVVFLTCSLLLPPSNCHLYQSVSSLRPTGRLLFALNILPTSSPALSGEVASHQHLSITLLPFFSCSSSLCLLSSSSTPCCFKF